MINIESDINTNSISTKVTIMSVTVMITVIELVSVNSATMDIEILTNKTLSLLVQHKSLLFKKIGVYESITYVVVLIEIQNDILKFVDIAFALLIIKVLVAVCILVELNRDFESISMSKKSYDSCKKN